MKKNLIIIVAHLLLTHAWAETKTTEKLTGQEIAEALVKHRDGSIKLSEDQDAVSADVQELIDEQTNEKVIQLLSEVETLMAEAIDELEQQKTGGETIAIETEIIEKIYEAAKEKSQEQNKNGQQNNQQSMGAMLEMMQRMMGKEPGKPNPSGEQKEGKEGGEQGNGSGLQGDSDSANDNTPGKASGNNSVRRVPKAAGQTGANLPREFQKALDAYNKN